MAEAFERIAVGGRALECAWFGDRAAAAEGPTLVFLHEGLGCVRLWRDFPAKLAQATGLPAFVYSRLGYGGSDPCELPRPLTYMHEEGREVLAQVLRAAGIGRHILVGHSDGASISIVYAGGTDAAGLEGMVLEAPHVFNEDLNVRSIREVRREYADGDLRPRLQRYHGDNVDCAFYGWADAWLDPGFLDWNLEEFLPGIAVPVLIVQGEDDQYGTIAQCEAIARQSGTGAEVVMLPDCGHSPHRDQEEAALSAMVGFVGGILRESAGR